MVKIYPLNPLQNIAAFDLTHDLSIIIDYRMWSWIEMKTVIIIPDNRLYTQRKRAQMTLMCYGSNKLHQTLYLT